MEIAVTGVTGFIGSHVFRAAAERGHDIRVLVRKPWNPPETKGTVSVFQGDVRDEESLRPFLRGADALIHVAGVNTPSSKQRDNIYSSNVEGARLILKTAQQAEVRRMVVTGSTAALGTRGRGKMNDEDTPFNLQNASTDYELSKYEEEKAVLDLHRNEGAPVIVVQPSACVGPGDEKPTYTGKLIIDYLQRKLPGYFDTRHNYVDVRDVAEGHLLALEKGEIGERYLLCGDDNILLSEFFGLLESLTGVKPPRLKLPLWMVFPLAYANHALWKITGTDPIIRISTAKRAWYDLYYSNQKAKKQLGYTTHNLRDALRDEIEWFLKNGRLDPQTIELRD